MTFSAILLVGLFPLLAPPTATLGDSAFVQPDVLLVRAAASSTAPIVSRLPINTFVEITRAAPDGWVAIRARNAAASPRDDDDAVIGYVRAELLGPPQTRAGLDAALAIASGDDVVTLLERIVALGGNTADKERLLTAARARGDKALVARATRLLAPAPMVIGVCFGGRVAVLGELTGDKLEVLVDTRVDADTHAPAVKANEARLMARALQMTTLRFDWQGGGERASGFLVQPSVVTRVDVLRTARSHIELGPCPQILGENSSKNGVVFVSAPLVIEQDAALAAADVAANVARLPSPVSGLRVFSPAGRLVELNTTDGVHLFQRGAPAPWACSTDACNTRRIRASRAPMWLTLRSGQQLRVGSQTEDVDNAGWGSASNAGLWVHPEFVVQVFDRDGVVVDVVVTLDQYGC